MRTVSRWLSTVTSWVKQYSVLIFNEPLLLSDTQIQCHLFMFSQGQTADAKNWRKYASAVYVLCELDQICKLVWKSCDSLEGSDQRGWWQKLFEGHQRWHRPSASECLHQWQTWWWHCWNKGDIGRWALEVEHGKVMTEAFKVIKDTQYYPFKRMNH